MTASAAHVHQPLQLVKFTQHFDVDIMHGQELTFCQPSAVQAVEEYVRGLEHKDKARFPMGLKDEVKLTIHELHMMQGKLGFDNYGYPKVFILRQFHVDKVYVPPGWLHFVVNEQPCVKLA